MSEFAAAGSPVTTGEDILTPDKLAFGARVLEFNALGNKVVIASREYSQKASSDKIDLILYDVTTRNTTQLTRANWGTRSLHPTLLASNIYDPERADYVTFVRSGKLHLIPLEGGESYEASSEALPIQSYRIFRDVHQELQVVMEMEVYSSMSPAETVAKDAETASQQGSGMHFDKLMLRHWDTWNPFQKRNHLFLKSFQMECDGTMRLDADSPAVDLMYGLETDCSTKGPAGQGAGDYAISSDGKYIAISCRRFDAQTGKQPSDFAWTTDIPIYLAHLTDAQPNKPLPWLPISRSDVRVYNSNPVFSLDNQYIAFLSMTRPQYESDRSRISLYHVPTQKLIMLTEDIDLAFASLKWDPTDPHILFASASYRASQRIFRLHLNEDYSFVEDILVMEGDESRMDFDLIVLDDPNAIHHYDEDLEEAQEIHNVGINKQKILIYAESTLVSPMEIKRATLFAENIALDPDTHIAAHLFSTWDNHSPITPNNTRSYASELRVLDQPQLIETVWCPFPAASNGDLNMPAVSQHYFPGANDEMVQCFYLAPPELADKALVAAHSLPLLVVIHGGPQSVMLNNWNYRWNLSTFASAGFAVVAINFHGSTSFGEAFCDSIRHDWGGKPHQDIVKGVRFITEKYPYIDPTRVAGLGASFGGFMINWINGHNEDQMFRCLVNHAGIFSLKSEFYTTEEIYFSEWEFGLPWDQAQKSDTEHDDYHLFSPDQFVTKWQTPTLVIQGGKDFRVPETESIATFTTLQRRQIPSEFLYFPDECHWILKPKNSLQWYTTIFRWLRKWLKET
jgi:acylaminoacyl-peptidase